MAVLEKRFEEAEIHGEVIEQQFNVLASAELFEILSDRIYPNKIKAVVRELSTNAVDATIDARKVSILHNMLANHAKIGEMKAAVNDNEHYVLREYETWKASNGQYDLSNWVERVPTVHLPNVNEPWFSIRDYGTGLDHETLMKLYVTYTWSDKKTSNDYTGCLGLGSKSPFAYTDQFTVTSYYNGEKRVYNAYLKNGFPSISIFKDDNGNEIVSSTHEPNGLEVSFPVKSKDIKEFSDEALNLYPYFKMPLEIVGNSAVKKTLEDIRKSKEDGKYYVLGSKGDIVWGVRKADGRGPYAIMGSIAYPISRSHSIKYGNKVNNVLAMDIDIQFPIGTLQITPSREHLSYKESTFNSINTLVNEVYDEIKEVIQEKISVATNIWDARVLINKLLYKSQLGVHFLDKSDIVWNGQKLTNFQYVDVKSDNYNVYRFDPDSPKRNIRSNVSNFNVKENVEIYEIDLPRGSFTRLEIECRTAHKEIYAIEYLNKQGKDEFIGKLGLGSEFKFKSASSLPVPTQAKRYTYSSESVVYKHVGYSMHSGIRQYQYWKDTNINDLKDGGVYVEMKRHKCVDANDQYITPDIIGTILDNLKDVGHEVTLIGVRNKLIKEFKQSDDWIDLNTYIRNVLNNEILYNDLDEVFSNKTQIINFKYEDEYLELLKYNTTSGDMSIFLKDLNDVYQSSKKIDMEKYPLYKKLAEYVKFDLNNNAFHDLKIRYEEISKKYPLLNAILGQDYGSNFRFTSNLEHIINYIDMIDKG